MPARDFIGAVETSEPGRIIDCLALEMGLAALAEEPALRLAINMSARSIGYPRWKRTLAHGLDGDATVAERLILEITEASAMLMPDIVQVFMDDLQRPASPSRWTISAPATRRSAISRISTSTS